jgi:hypothetical protein
LEFQGAIYHVMNRGNYRKDLFGEKGAAGRPGREVRELCEAKGEMALDALLRRARKSRREINRSPKSAPWKIRIAREMKRGTTATNPWLAAALGMGHPSRVCNLVSDI